MRSLSCTDFATVRTLLDFFGPIPNSRDTQIKVLQTNIEWAKQEKRIFLKHSLETRLVGLYVAPRFVTLRSLTALQAARGPAVQAGAGAD